MFCFQLKLHDILDRSAIDGNIFILHRAIIYIGSTESMGHYALMGRTTGLWKEFNDKVEKMQRSNTQEEVRCLLLLCTKICQNMDCE